MKMSVSEYLTSKSLEGRKEGQETRFNCMFCDDHKLHLYINDEKGVFYCHKCGEAGNIWKLKRHFNDECVIEYRSEKKAYKKPAKDLIEKYSSDASSAKEYLKRVRGLTDASIAKFKLGQFQDYISIPYFKNNEVVNFKYRGIGEKKFQRFKDGESCLYNVDNIDKSKDVIVVEGELDAISCDQLGYPNVISITNGAQGWNPDWIDFFDSCSGDFYIAYDNDEKGNEGAKKIAEKIGIHRTKRLKLPLKDFNDCLMAGYKTSDVASWISSAQEYKIENLVHISDVYSRIDALYQRSDRGSGLQLHSWFDLNAKLGGLRETELIVVTGDTGSGKSMFTKNIFFSLLSQGEKVMIASTEENIEAVVTALFTMYRGKNFKNFSDEDYQACILWFADKPIYFIDIHGRLSIDQIEEYVEYATRKYDVKYILLDHLHFFIRHISDNPVQDIENFVFSLVALARKTSVNMWLVAHVAKLDNSKGIVSMNDIKGSSAIKQDAHAVITIRRDSKAEEDGRNEVIINCEKVRHISGCGGKKRYLFNTETLCYKECIAEEEEQHGYKRSKRDYMSAL